MCIETIKADLKARGITDLESLIKYDFTYFTANEKYKKLNGLEKFFVYKLKFIDKWKMEYNGKMTYEHAFKKRSDLGHNGFFDGIVDPDSNSDLLQRIYRCLWDDDNILEICEKRDQKICGDTMNSANTTLNVLIASNKTESQQFKTMTRSNQNMSITYIINKYYSNAKNDFSNSLNNKKELIEFLNTYHNLGNFIPFPVGCNGPRGLGRTKDYWDLTLLYIYNYYHGEKDAIKKIYSDNKVKIRFEEWLEVFGDWDSFVKKNYMEDFLENGKPKVFWEGHSIEKPLPANEECIKYFKNATEMIKKRSERMAKKLVESGIILE